MNYNQEQFIPFGSKEVFGNRVGQSFSATRLQSQEITVAKENMMRRAE